MKRKILIVFILAILDGSLLYYFQTIETSKKEFVFTLDEYPILVYTNNIELKDIKNFDFNTYFKIYSFNELNYKYNFINENLEILFNDNYYYFPYKLIEPEIQTEVVYIEKEVIKENNDEYLYIDEDFFYVDNDYLIFDINEDLSSIRQVLSSNIHTTYETNIDYSELNVSQIGQYSVFYITDSQKIEIIVEIR